MKQTNLMRGISLLCILALLVSLCPGVFAYGASSSWAREELDHMEVLGLIPETLAEKEDLRGAISRLEMCQISLLAYETYTGAQIVPENEQPFTDTDSEVAAKAYAVGLISGYPDGTFLPEGTLTRQEFFAFVHKFLLAAGWQGQERGDLSVFEDADTLSSWVEEAAQVVVGLGIVQGSGGKLRPKDITPCEQALVMFLRGYLALIGTQYPDKYPNMAPWAVEELAPMEEEGLIPRLLVAQDMTSPITRREVSHIAVNAFMSLYPDIPMEDMTNPFVDTDDEVVVAAYHLGIVSGYPTGEFKPEDPITREQLFTIIGNFLTAAGYFRTDDPSADLSVFADGDQVRSYALPATRLLYSMGIVKGSGGRLAPQDDTQCQQALALFYRTYNAFLSWLQAAAERPEADALVVFAMQFVGYPYIWAGESPETGFDCSGLVYYVFREFGYKVPRTATLQFNYTGAVPVELGELLPGDLVFFSDTQSTSKITHVGIYIGNDQYLHAANPKRGVVIDSIYGAYFTSTYVGARRIIP